MLDSFSPGNHHPDDLFIPSGSSPPPAPGSICVPLKPIKKGFLSESGVSKNAFFKLVCFCVLFRVEQHFHTGSCEGTIYSIHDCFIPPLKCEGTGAGAESPKRRRDKNGILIWSEVGAFCQQRRRRRCCSAGDRIKRQVSPDTPRSPESTLGRLMRSEGKRGTRKDLQGSRSSEEALMEPGGPGGRGASCSCPQPSYFTYSCFGLWICSCWPHRHHISILNPLPFPPLL